MALCIVGDNVASVNTMNLLHEGVAAAKAGDAATARLLLKQSTELYPESELAWFWLAYVSDSPQDRVTHLKRVLEINPAQEQARTVLHRALLQSGIHSAKAGDRRQARAYLEEAVAINPTHELSWMWLASVSANQQEALACIRQALAINPQNERAQNWLAKLQPATVLEPDPDYPYITPPPEAVDLLLSEICKPQSQNEEPQAAVVTVDDSQDEPAAGEELPLAEEPQPETAAQRVVLFVDDSPTVCKLVSVALEHHGYRVLVAGDGLEALAKLDETVPDFILLDVAMPHMNGFQLCKRIKANAETKRIPVAMLSGKDGFFDRMRGRLAGAEEYLTKPFEPATLIQVIEKYCPQNA